MRKTLAFIASVGVLATATCGDDFLPHKEPEFKKVEVEQDKEVAVRKSAEVEVQKAQAASFEKTLDKDEYDEHNSRFAERSHEEKDFEASASQVGKGRVSRAKADHGAEEFENVSSNHNSEREGGMAVIKKHDHDQAHKNLEEHEEFVEECEHIDSIKDRDCEKLNHKRWMKKKHQKKAFNEKRHGHKESTLSKKNGKGQHKVCSEARKGEKHHKGDKKEDSSFVRVNKKKLEKEFDLRTGRFGSEHESEFNGKFDSKKGSEKSFKEFDAEKDSQAKFEINKEFEASIRKD